MRHPFLDELRRLDLPPEDYVLFGSGPLLVRGWIDDVGDLDVVARGAAWDAARALGETVHLATWDVTVVQIGNVTVGTRWAIGDPDPDQLIDRAEVIDDIRCARIVDVVAYKSISNRPKDRLHLSIIEAHEYST